MARIQDMTKAQLVALIVTDLGIQTDGELRRDVALATRFRRRRRLEREMQAAANAAADAAFQSHMAAQGALAAEPPIGDDE